ncbi:MAG: hypothetical protein KDJ23_02640 [Rhodoblastus sp.]|nr:hypothetical protein [Rhodoblastus sp.]MCB1522971.1 hypothetical protein [Rhodoblastus sp.]
MAPKDKERVDIEYPRGEIEIIAPGQDSSDGTRRCSPFEFEGASAQRTYTFQTKLSGFLGLVFAVVIASGLFVFVAGFLAVVVTIAIAVVAGFILRNKLRQLFGR